MANRTPLAKLLLAKVPEIPSSPLFRSQVELIKLIMGMEDSGYTEEPNLRSYLNQVLLGKRRCNEKVANCIVRAATAKASNSKQRAAVEDLIREAIQIHNDLIVPQYHSSFPDEVPIGEIFERMYARQKMAENIFIINMRPLELVPKPRDQMRRDLSQETFKDLLKGKSYVFCVADDTPARLLWEAFYKEAIASQEKGEEGAAAILAELEERDLLTVYVIPPAYCVHPTVVYNAGSPERASGWIWYVPWDPKQLAEIPKGVLENWTREYFDPIIAGQLPNQKRVTWLEVKKWMEARKETPQ